MVAYSLKKSLYLVTQSKLPNISEHTPEQVIGRGEYVSERNGVRCSFEPSDDFSKQNNSEIYLNLARLLQESINYSKPYFLHNMYELITGFTTSKENYLVPKMRNETMTFIDREISIKLKSAIFQFNVPDNYTLDSIVSQFDPLQLISDSPMPRRRADGALKGLKDIKHYYHKDKTGKEAFENGEEPPNNSTCRIQNPTLAEVDSHSIIDEIEKMIIEFKKTYDLDLTHFAMSPNTAVYLAENAWKNGLLRSRIDEYRGMGGVKEFPGIGYAKAVMSVPCPDDEIYAIAKDCGPMRLYDGAKTLTVETSDSGNVTQIFSVDYHQYKCVHDDLKGPVLGCTIKLQT